MIKLRMMIRFFFFNDTATTEIYTLSLHDALPIYPAEDLPAVRRRGAVDDRVEARLDGRDAVPVEELAQRSEEHTSELQSRQYLVCRLLLEKKKKKVHSIHILMHTILCSYYPIFYM